MNPSERMIFVSEYEIGQVVYLKTDREALPRIITVIEFSANGVMYNLSCGDRDSRHYGIEIVLQPVYT